MYIGTNTIIIASNINIVNHVYDRLSWCARQANQEVFRLHIPGHNLGVICILRIHRHLKPQTRFHRSEVLHL